MFSCLLLFLSREKVIFSDSYTAINRRPLGVALMANHPHLLKWSPAQQSHPFLKDCVWPLFRVIPPSNPLRLLRGLQSTDQGPCRWRKPFQSAASTEQLRGVQEWLGDRSSSSQLVRLSPAQDQHVMPSENLLLLSYLFMERKEDTKFKPSQTQ